MPHPNGEIEVNYLLKNKVWSIEINLTRSTCEKVAQNFKYQ